MRIAHRVCLFKATVSRHRINIFQSGLHQNLRASLEPSMVSAHRPPSLPTQGYRIAASHQHISKRAASKPLRPKHDVIFSRSCSQTQAMWEPASRAGRPASQAGRPSQRGRVGPNKPGELGRPGGLNRPDGPGRPGGRLGRDQISAQKQHPKSFQETVPRL